jgi:ATP-dependent Lon protease
MEESVNKEMIERDLRGEFAGDFPSEIPIIPLRNTVVFPVLTIPLTVGREKSLASLEEALLQNKVIGIVTQRDPETEDPDGDDLYQIGVIAKILKLIKLPDGSQNIVVQGFTRFKTREFIHREPYIKVAVEVITETTENSIEAEALMVNLKNMAKRAIDLSPAVPEEAAFVVQNLDNPGILADLIASNLKLGVSEKQEILETLSTNERLKKVTEHLLKEIHVLELSNKIQSQVKGEIDKSHREYYLREQMKVIKKELGEMEDEADEAEELRSTIEKSAMPEHAKKVAFKELHRLERISPHSPEHAITRTYLDWLVELPWETFTEDHLDIAEASRVLNEDHYGLDKVKKRILEYLAVLKLKKDLKGPILCLVGPPGVGKTSLGKSVAKAVGRKFVRMSLGGVRDEAEIRGHRRTYVGALPGRIVQGMKRSGSGNPVFMLDEIDKLGSDFRGDPSSAMLEVLDPEQNNTFQDHYLEVPYDLSKVLFIATANQLDTIPAPLRDRMEIIEVAGYTQEEKAHIARGFLLPEQLEEHGLVEKNLELTDEGLAELIEGYTRESGVRGLKRAIAAICRGVAKRVAEGKRGRVKVTAKEIPDYLGPRRFHPDIVERVQVPGVAVGLAWTPVGGDILFIEATKMKGKGNLQLTGQLGDVMKESAQAAMSYIKSKAREFHVNEDIFDDIDVHIHVPAGAIPKDGPSAGVTILTTLASLLSGIPVREKLAMTGEITLRGLVLPVGGIKEKVIAAKRAGVKTIILPDRNKADVLEIPKDVIKGVAFHYVTRMDEVLSLALDKKHAPKAVKPAGSGKRVKENYLDINIFGHPTPPAAH